jgi:hypothetical protein
VIEHRIMDDASRTYERRNHERRNPRSGRVERPARDRPIAWSRMRRDVIPESTVYLPHINLSREPSALVAGIDDASDKRLRDHSYFPALSLDTRSKRTANENEREKLSNADPSLPTSQHGGR